MTDDKKFKPKYIARVPLKKDSFRYFYTKAEYQAYLNARKAKKEALLKKSSLTNLSDNVKKESSKKSLMVTAPTKKVPDAGKNMATVIDNGKKLVEKTIVKTEGSSTETIGGLSETGKKAIARLLGGRIGLAIYNAATSIIDKVKNRNQESDEEKEKPGVTEESENRENQSYQESFLESEPPETFDDIPRLDGDMPDDEDQATINEWYAESINHGDDAATQNCSYCTAAYDLRQRGYDVEAGPWTETDEPTTVYEILSWYDNPQPYSLEYNQYQVKEAASLTESELLKQGDGARGHFLLYWQNGGGHDVVYEVKNNKVIIRDCQTNETLKLEDYMQYAKTVTFFRTDNLNVNDNVLDKVRINDD